MKEYSKLHIEHIKVSANAAHNFSDAIFQAHLLAFTENRMVILDHDGYRYMIEPALCIQDCAETREGINPKEE